MSLKAKLVFSDSTSALKASVQLKVSKLQFYYDSPVNLCIKREVIPNKGIPLPQC